MMGLPDPRHPESDEWRAAKVRRFSRLVTAAWTVWVVCLQRIRAEDSALEIVLRPDKANGKMVAMSSGIPVVGVQ